MKFLPAALLAGLLTGCLGEPAREPADIVPLAVGNTWTYVDSQQYGGDSLEVFTTVTSITGARVITVNGESHAVFLQNAHNRFSGLPGNYSTYVKNFGHSNYTMGARKDSTDVFGKSLHLEYPTKTGREYDTYFFDLVDSAGALVPKMDTIHVKVANARETCAEPAGTFTCVRYQGYKRDGTLYATGWYAPGVGYLGSESISTEISGTPGDSAVRQVRFRKRLSSYTLY